MNEPVETTVRYFLSGYNCCQSILMTYGPRYGLDKETAAKLGAGMGGGLGHTGHVCGFISGAILVLGLKEKNNFDPDHSVEKMQTVERAASFLDDCRKAFGHIECRELIQCSIRTQEELGQAIAAGRMNICGTQYLQGVVRLLEEKYLK